MDYIKVIEYFGKIGSADAKKIISDLNLPRSNVYNILNNLERDGRIKILDKKGKRIIYALHDYEPLEELIKRELRRVCGETYSELVEKKHLITPNHFEVIARLNNIDPFTESYRKAVLTVIQHLKLNWLHGNSGHFGNEN